MPRSSFPRNSPANPSSNSISSSTERSVAPWVANCMRCNFRPVRRSKLQTFLVIRALRKDPAMATKDEIQSTIDNNDVVLFMKGTPDFPQCGFSGQVVQILNYLDVSYKPVNCLASDEIRQGIKEFSD